MATYDDDVEKQDCELTAFKRLSKGKRKITQEGWDKLLFAAILTIGLYGISVRPQAIMRSGRIMV